jgi:hypothetical protein
MSTAAEDYQHFAEECLRWARDARTEADRKAFLDMAKTWAKAAARLTNGHAVSSAMTARGPVC